ncbi:MAG: hypothetical protein HY710_14010 [Candidatus Latescibacteria bacterium]|nr:hypothetical protein [Candidatus Latescibacterota bacterium]
MTSRYLLLALLTTACGAVRPDPQLGPVIDASQNVSVVEYPLGGGSSATRTVFIRHFLYVARPAQWTILSSGDSRPVTLFEETGVYALRPKGTRLTVTRLGLIPGVRTDGVRPPRVHLAIGFSRILNRDGIVALNPSAIVYIEDGPIYGLDVGGDLDPATNSDRPVTLLVDGRAHAAALAADGKTVAYADVNGQVFMAHADSSGNRFLADVRAQFGQVSISAMQWAATVDARGAIQPQRVLIRLNYGLFDQVWAASRFALFQQVFSIPVEFIPRSDSAQRLDVLNLATQAINSDEWRVPDPQQFSP